VPVPPNDPAQQWATVNYESGKAYMPPPSAAADGPAEELQITAGEMMQGKPLLVSMKDEPTVTARP